MNYVNEPHDPGKTNHCSFFLLCCAVLCVCFFVLVATGYRAERLQLQRRHVGLRQRKRRQTVRSPLSPPLDILDIHQREKAGCR